MARSITAYRLGMVPYAEALALQERLVAARVAGTIGDVLLLLQHPKVVTLGRRASRDNVLFSEEALRAQGYELFETGRGGDVTFHGPGQLVGYPIVSLSPEREDVRRYVKDLEATMIGVCARYGFAAERVEGLNGAWLGARKVGAVGVRISRWVTMHGFALNVNTDLGGFNAIVACGIRDRGVTSLAEELGHSLPFDEVAVHAAEELAARFDASLAIVDGAPAV
jgi:lipoyl(octanoyl) transferase